MEQTQELIVVRQLPVIEEQLRSVKPRVEARIREVLALPCTEDTVKEIKKERAKLNGELAVLEEQRKAAKSAIMAPYDHFNEVYADCVSKPYKNADAELKRRIETVEGAIKQEREDELRQYYSELVEVKRLSFVPPFEKIGLNVTLSAAMGTLRKQIADFVEDVESDLTMIEFQTYKDEILVEYKQSLNASEAIVKVQNRHTEIEAEQKRREAASTAAEAAQDAEAKVDEVIDAAESAPVVAKQGGAQILATKFTVRGTIDQLRKLKEFLIREEYDYEQSND